jgi:hypothetical protein
LIPEDRIDSLEESQTQQLNLFGWDEAWKDEWVEMPEYIMTRILPFDEIIVRFKTEEDMKAFFELINQNIPNKLKSIWYPKVEIKKATERMVYVDEP